MPLLKTGAFVSFEDLAMRARHHVSMAETYLRIVPEDDPRRGKAEELAAAERAQAQEITREYLS